MTEGPKVRTVPIAGFRHYPAGDKVLRNMRPGTPLRLVREPTNQHDHLAVQVWSGAVLLGYVPKAANVDVAWALDAKSVLVKAVFAGHNLGHEPAMQIVWPISGGTMKGGAIEDAC
jgi:hypothetical protein